MLGNVEARLTGFALINKAGPEFLRKYALAMI